MKDNSKEINQMCKQLHIKCQPSGYVTTDYFYNQIGMLNIMPAKYILPTEIKMYKTLSSNVSYNSRRTSALKHFIKLGKPIVHEHPNNYIFTNLPVGKFLLPTALDLLHNYLMHEYREASYWNWYYTAILKYVPKNYNSDIRASVKYHYIGHKNLIQLRIKHANAIKHKYMISAE